MSDITLQSLRSLVNERLSAAAEDILGVFERTVANYEEEVFHCKKEINRQKKLLGTVLLPETRLQRPDPQQLLVCEEGVPPELQERSPSLCQEDPEPLQIKEEWEELWTSQDGEHLQDLEEADIIKFTSTHVHERSEHDEEKPQSSWFNQTQTEENRAEPLASTSTEQMKTETDGEVCGESEPAGNFNPSGDLEPSRDGWPLSSDCSGAETDDSDQWKRQSGLNTSKSKKAQKNKGQVVLSSDDDVEEADDARTGSVSPRPTYSAHSSTAPSWGRVEVAVNSTGEWEDITSEFSEDVDKKISLTRKRCMTVQVGQNVPQLFSPMEKKPKVAPKKCESIILECRSVRLGSLGRIQTPVVMDFLHEELESDSSEPELSSHTGLQATRITEYKPTRTASSSSHHHHPDFKNRDKALSWEILSSDEDLKGTDSREDKDQQIAESPLSTSVSVPQRRKRGREVVVRDLSTSLAKRLPQKKRGKKKGPVKKTNGASDVFSKNRPDQCEDERSDMEDQSTRLAKRLPQKRRGKKKGAVKETDQSTRMAKRLPQKKKGGKKGAVKESEAPRVQLKRPWSEAERTAVNKRLGMFMAERRVPGKEDCVKCITEEKSLDQRSWKDVKNFVYNTIVTLNRRSASQKPL